jgi:putative hydrolase of the HAD superfamily
MIKAIIFDCFGVLVGKGFEYTYRMAGGDPQKDRSFIEDTLNQANLGLITNSDFQESMARKLGITTAAWSRSIKAAEQLNTDLLTYIAQLRVNYKTAILSNANKQVLDKRIGKDWLQKDFDEIIVSAEVGMVKPDPRIYQLVINRLGVLPEQCLYIDDRPIFLVTARQLGMRVFLYENFSHFKHNLDELLS